jgi:hypothetical protein
MGCCGAAADAVTVLRQLVYCERLNVVCRCDIEYSQSSAGVTHSAYDAIVSFESADIQYSLLDFQKVPLQPFVLLFRERQQVVWTI